MSSDAGNLLIVFLCSREMGHYNREAVAHINGYAHTNDWEIEAAKRRARYMELCGDTTRAKIITSSAMHYRRNSYTVTVPPKIDVSFLDILILCDRGDTCFGECVEDKDDGNFTVGIYTD